MGKYNVKLMSRAVHDLEGIYNYIVHKILESEMAQNLVAGLRMLFFHCEF